MNYGQRKIASAEKHARIKKDSYPHIHNVNKEREKEAKRERNNYCYG